MHKDVDGIPCVFVVGWRGEPDIPDEPQHIYQGELTLTLLETLGIKSMIICRDTTEYQVNEMMKVFLPLLAAGQQVAFVVRKDALETDTSIIYTNNYVVSREEAIRQIVGAAEDDVVISTTGKISRELFEIRESIDHVHERDFLTVSSMGHSSTIALGIALQKPHKRVWCIDGDGAFLMHMGAAAVIGASAPNNLIHIVLYNEAHETVGGMPTVAGQIDLPKIAERLCISHYYAS